MSSWICHLSSQDEWPLWVDFKNSNINCLSITATSVYINTIAHRIVMWEGMSIKTLYSFRSLFSIIKLNTLVAGSLLNWDQWWRRRRKTSVWWVFIHTKFQTRVTKWQKIFTVQRSDQNKQKKKGEKYLHDLNWQLDTYNVRTNPTLFTNPLSPTPNHPSNEHSFPLHTLSPSPGQTNYHIRVTKGQI